MSIATHPVPVTIISGYLGAGKTTLVNHLLRNADGKRLAIMVNEFGELPIDADLIEAEGDDVISLAGGCVCCSYGNDLMMAMMEMSEMGPSPDHVVLEASGVALPGAIASSLSLLEGYSIDGIIVLADAEMIEELANDKFMGDTILRQLADADIVLLNKIDLVSLHSLPALRNWLKETAPGAKIIDAERSIAPVSVLLRDNGAELNSNLDAAHHASVQFTTETIKPSGPVDAAELADQLIVNHPALVRAKGFVQSLEGGMQTIQIAGKRIEVTPAPKGVEPGVVLISAPSG